MSPRSNQKPSFGQRSTLKKHVTSMSCRLEPAIWSHDTGQQIPYFDRCQLIITWMSDIKEVHGKPRLHVSVNLVSTRDFPPRKDGISRRPSSSPRVCTDGVRSVGRTLTSEPNFLCLMGYHFSLPMVLRWRASRAEAPLLGTLRSETRRL